MDEGSLAPLKKELKPIVYKIFIQLIKQYIKNITKSDIDLMVSNIMKLKIFYRENQLNFIEFTAFNNFNLQIQSALEDPLLTAKKLNLLMPTIDTFYNSIHIDISSYAYQVLSVYI